MKISTIPSPLDSPRRGGDVEMGVERGDGDFRSNREGTPSEVGEDVDGRGLPEEMGGVHLFRINS